MADSRQQNLYVLDSDKTAIGILSNRMPFSLPFYEDLQERSLDDFTDTLTFKIPANHKEAEKVTTDGYILYPEINGQLKLYKIQEVTEVHDGGQYYKEVYAEISAQDDLIKDVVRPISFSSATLEDVATAILSGTGWAVGYIEDFGLKDYDITEYPTKLQALIDAVKEYGGELEFEYVTKGTTVIEQRVNIVSQIGEETGKTFMYGKDVVGVERVEDRSKLVTALIGVGKDVNGVPLTFSNETASQLGVPTGFEKPNGVDWVGNLEAVKNYSKNGEHIFGVFKDDKAQSSYELFKNTLEALKKYSKPLMTYKASVVLLERLAGYSHEAVRLGDTIMVQDKSIKPELYVKARIRKLSRSITQPENDAVELGDYIPVVPPVNKRIADIQAKIRAKEEVWNKAEEIPAIQQTISQLPTKEDLFSVPSQRLKVRYVRDWVNGSNMNQANHWIEVKVFHKGVNIASGKAVTTNAPAITNAQYVTDDRVDSDLYARTDGGSPQYVQIDLGQVYEDVEYIHVWHYYYDGRTYNQHFVDVSEDGQNWTRLYNSDRHGTHKESVDGLIVPVNSSAIIAKQNKELGDVVQAVENLEQFKQSTEVVLDQKVDLIEYNDTVNQLAQDIAEKAGLDYVNGQLQTKADSTTVDSLTQEIATKAGLDYVNGQLTAKADKANTYTKTEVDNALNGKVSVTTYQTDQNAIVTRLDNAETAIEQNESAIALKASQSSVDSLTSRVTNAEAQLSVQAGQIATKVEQTTFNTELAKKEGSITKSSTAPSNPATNALWLDTSVTPNILKRWTGSAWVKATPSTAGEVGAYTKAETDAKATTAENNAKSYADGKIAPLATRMTNAETSITQTQNELALKASQTEVDSLSTEVGSLTTRVSNAEASITANANAIALKASQADLDTLEGRVSSAESQLTVQAGQIATKVTATEVRDIARRTQVVKARYVRVLGNGNTVNNANHLVELMVMRAGTNIAQGKTITASDAGMTNPQYMTDGIINSGQYTFYGFGSQWVQIDLGQVYDDIDYIKIWHYFWDATRYYLYEVQVSEDAVNWISLFDTEKDGRHKHTDAGFIILVNQQKALQSMESSIKQNADSISLKVSKDSIISEINQSAEQVTIQANKINLVGAVGADAIQAGAVTADKLDVRAKSLMNNPTATGVINGWTAENVSGATANLLLQTSGSRSATVLMATSDGRLDAIHDYIPINPSESYKLTASIYCSSSVGTRSVYVYAYDKNMVLLNVTPYSPADKTTPLSATTQGILFQQTGVVSGNAVGGYMPIEVYVLGSEADVTQAPTGKGVYNIVKMPPNARFLRIAFSHAGNTAGTPTNFFIFSPTLTTVDAGVISFDSAKGGTLQLGGNGNTNGDLRVLSAEGDVIAHLGVDSAGFGTIKADYIEGARNLVQSANVLHPNFVPDNNRLEFYVDGLYGSDATGDGTRANPYATIQTAIDNVPRYLDFDAYIMIYPTKYDENILITGFKGEGQICLVSNAWDVRYIRDWSNGSSANTANHWVEIQAIDQAGTNRALGKTPTTNATTNPTYPLSRITDGTVDTNLYASTSGVQNAYVQIDLGANYDIGRILVHKYWYDARQYYGIKTEVSSDGVNWRLIWDNDAWAGRYKENANGHTRMPYINGTITVQSCDKINLSSLYVDARSQGVVTPVYLFSVAYGYLYNIVAWGNGSQQYVYYFYSSYGRMHGCEGNKSAGAVICSAYGSRVDLFSGNKGGDSPRGIFCYSSSIVAGDNSGCPKGTISDTLTSYGGQIPVTFTGVGGTYTVQGDASPPPAPAPQPTVKTWTSTYSESWRPNFSGQWSGGSTGRDVIQGEWAGYGVYMGYWFFGDAIRSAVQGKNISKIRVYLTRNNSGGISSAQTAYIRLHNYASKPSGSSQPSYVGSDYVTASFKWGEGKWVDVTSKFKDEFQAGTARGIMLYLNSTADSGYMRFSGTAKIEITYS
jgi:phage minor structural protein